MKRILTGVILLLSYFSEQAHSAEFCRNLFNTSGSQSELMSHLETQAVLSYLHKFGLRLSMERLLSTSADKLLQDVDAMSQKTISDAGMSSLKSAIEQFQSGRIDLREFHRQVYFAVDTAESTFLPLASGRSDLHPYNDSREDRSNSSLAYILRSVRPTIANGPFGFGFVGWLPGLLKVAEIRGEESQSPSRLHGLAEPGKLVSVVLWTASDASGKDAIAVIDSRLPRLMITGTKLGSQIRISTVEGMIFNESNKAWEPVLYEMRDGKLVKVFESEDGVHSIHKCVRCHGVRHEFSPIPFKFRRNYEPSRGWFDKEKVNDKPVHYGFGSWSVAGAWNTYNSIKESRFDWRTQSPTAKDYREIYRRLTNNEIVHTLYPESSWVRPKQWRVSWRENAYFSIYDSPETKFLFEQVMTLKKLAASSTSKRSPVEVGAFVMVLPGDKFRIESYSQAQGENTSIDAAVGRVQKYLATDPVVKIYRLHFRSPFKSSHLAVRTPAEMAFDQAVEEKLIFSNGNRPSNYEFTLLFNRRNGISVGVSPTNSN